jgi:chaperonin GroES
MKKETKTKESKMGVQLLGDRVLVRPEEAMKKTASGILIPDAAKGEKATRGTVLAVGPGRMNDDGKVLPMSVRVGQKVFFNPGWESEIEMGDEKLHLIHETDIKAVIK